MGWGNSKAVAWKRQNGLCSICQKPVSLNSAVGHHKINKCQRGPSTAENCEIRHVQCERDMHKNFPFGNYKGDTSAMANRQRRRRRSGVRHTEVNQVCTPQMEGKKIVITVENVTITIEVK